MVMNIANTWLLYIYYSKTTVHLFQCISSIKMTFEISKQDKSVIYIWNKNEGQYLNFCVVSELYFSYSLMWTQM